MGDEIDHERISKLLGSTYREIRPYRSGQIGASRLARERAATREIAKAARRAKRGPRGGGVILPRDTDVEG